MYNISVYRTPQHVLTTVQVSYFHVTFLNITVHSIGYCSDISLLPVCDCSYIAPAVAFRIYDIDQDGFISNGELYQVCVRIVVVPSRTLTRNSVGS